MGFDINQINGLTQDSRRVEPGFLFAAIKGEKSDGHDYIDGAIADGATHILANEGTKVPPDVTLITHENPRQKFAQLTAEFYRAQPEHIAAITGTNGKTSIVSFLEQLWKAAGYEATSLGTLNGNMTTLETVALHQELAAQAASGTTHLAMEASSHGLDQCRLHGARVNVAGFTNLSRDHLDYHGDMEGYLAAKTKLFSEVLEEGGTAVLNADIPEFASLKAVCEAHNIRIIDYGHKAQAIRLNDARPSAHGQTLQLTLFGQDHAIELPLVGAFQAMNALCALGMALAQDMDNEDVYLVALAKINGAKGRLQSVTGHPHGAGIYVDYAHTPDALENVLNALRPHTQGQLYCIMGCGGDRDKGKRPLMGEISMRLADVTIVTDDNPRSEDPATIRAEILNAAPGASEVGDRAQAIKDTTVKLGQGDVLVIAGKGHEQGQIFKDHTAPFDDVEQARGVIQTLIKTSNGKLED
jgi:UDP-N-acetylmuramoyl-L-alanyl-D-glutamate--2,6-diaminopimelate ligase